MSMNRRSFLAASLATGLVVATDSTAAPSTETDARRLTKADLASPALLVDLDVFESNLKLMAEQCKQAGCGFRPHAKTHKCPEIAKRQVAVGALGVCVATVPEAEAM